MSKLQDILTAITFAEANEHEFAKEIIRNIPKKKKTKIIKQYRPQLAHQLL